MAGVGEVAALVAYVNEAAVTRLRHGLPPCSTKTGAYCKARQRMPLDMVSEMVTHTGQLIAEKVPERWRWHGRRVLLADGTIATRVAVLHLAQGDAG